MHALICNIWWSAFYPNILQLHTGPKRLNDIFNQQRLFVLCCSLFRISSQFDSSWLVCKQKYNLHPNDVHTNEPHIVQQSWDQMTVIVIISASSSKVHHKTCMNKTSQERGWRNLPCKQPKCLKDAMTTRFYAYKFRLFLKCRECLKILKGP